MSYQIERQVQCNFDLGWALGKFDADSSGEFKTGMEKGAGKLSLRVYDFANTGVII